jgi:hypothetical protein
MATSIPLFVSLEVFFIDALGRLGLLATVGYCAPVTVLWMVGVIYVATEFAGAMKPRASADEDVPAEPFRAVVAGGSTAIRSGVIVTIGAFRGYTDIDADLSLCAGGGCRETGCSNCTQH